jgi:hypothetical protein
MFLMLAGHCRCEVFGHWQYITAKQGSSCGPEPGVMACLLHGHVFVVLSSRSGSDHWESQVLHYDLLVGADGAMSAVRQAMVEHCPGMKVRFCACVCWWEWGEVLIGGNKCSYGMLTQRTGGLGGEQQLRLYRY